jgi:acetoin utilization deacetylase AcuC-like enzyme
MRAFFDPEQMRHDPQQFMRVGRICAPSDVPERSEALLGALTAQKIPVEAPRDYGIEPLAKVHAPHYLEYLSTAYDRWMTVPGAGIEVLPNVAPYLSGRIEDDIRPPCPSDSPVAQAGYYLGDLSCPIGPHTWHSIVRSAHCAVAAADAVLAGEGASYALCRPSGHHVRGDRASGFCYLNNAAIAVERLRSRFDRVAVLDVDAHHGDGTQTIFYRRADVLTVSLHVDPANYYPFYTGYAGERGHGSGLGYNLNLPLAPGAGDRDLLARLDEGIEAVSAHRPQALVLSLGFDTHGEDPIGALHTSTACFGEIGAKVRDLSLPTAVIQEGGYGVHVIGACLSAFMRGFLRR